MNERIMELAKLADDGFGNDIDDMPDALMGLEAIEKFAELIILECEKVAKNPEWYSENPSNGWRNPIQHVCRTFKEHFEIKE